MTWRKAGVKENEREEEFRHGYGKKGFPWWLTLAWVAVVVWAIVYWILYTFPNIMLWLKGYPLK